MCDHDFGHEVSFRPEYIPETAELSRDDPHGRGTPAAVHRISTGIHEDLFITRLRYLCVPSTWRSWCLKSHLTFCVLRLTWPGMSIPWCGLGAFVLNQHGQSWFNSSWSYQTSAERFLLKAKLKVWSVCSGVYIHLFICS